jgi:uncharacterized small protein (DUF1192 family)
MALATSEELQAQVAALRATAARLMAEASKLAERAAHLEDLISRQDATPPRKNLRNRT